MTFTNRLYAILILLLVVFVPISLYAGGPGFDTDVYTWGTDEGDDDSSYDDDGSGGDDDDSGGDDDDSGGDDDDGDDDDSGGDDDDDGNEIPLDGGLSFLAAAGGAYAIKKYKDTKSKK